MNKKTLVISLAGVAAFVLLTSVTYICVKKYRNDNEALLQYQAGLQRIFNRDNTFVPEAQLAFYDSLELIPGLEPRKAMVVQLYKGATLLKLGQEKKAVEILAALAADAERLHETRLLLEINKQLGLAYIRWGERNNCVSNHTSGSCIFPISGTGVYKDPTATAMGINTYMQALQADPSDLESRWMLNVAYMTIGAYPAKVPPAYLIPGLDTDTSQVKVNAFVDMSRDLHLNDFRSQAGGCIVDDFNNDGYLDIVTSSWDLEESMHYFRNNADGTFSDVSAPSGLSAIKGGLNIQQADFDNDGFTDILVLRGAWLGAFGTQPNSLLRNNGDGTFSDVTISSGLLSFRPTQTGTWADFNNDGWVDLFIGNETTPGGTPYPSQLYINNHDGTFKEVAQLAGCEKLGFMKGVTSGDYNKDGWPDVFISCRDGQKFLLKNKGESSNIPQFEDVTHAAGLDSESTFTFPTWFWDYDNDGWPDIFVCGYRFSGSLGTTAAAESLGEPLPPNTSMMYLYHNNHDGTFTDISREAGLHRPVFSMGSNFGDIDNDGWSDMYLGTGNPDFTSLVPNKMFRNIGGQKFADVTASARVGNLQKGHGVAFADVDNDGDQDVFVEVGGAFKGDAYYNSFYVNPGQGDNNWISVKLEGVKSNRSAIGAHITVAFTEDGVKRSVYMDINSGGSFGGNPFRKSIGIGKATMVDELTVQWPATGVTQVFKNIAPRQFMKIKENSAQMEKISLNRLDFKHSKENMNMISCAPGK